MLASIENYYERLVMECIRESLRDSAESADEDLVDDLACLALNALPPRYVRHAVDLFSHLGDEDRDVMRQEVAEAVGMGLATIRRRRMARDEG